MYTTRLQHTILIRRDILPGNRILLRHLILQMLLPLLQHVQLAPQHQDGVFGRILPLLRGRTAEPGPHFDGGLCL